MFKKRTLLAMGLGAAAMWYADPVSGATRRAALRRTIDTAGERTTALREQLPHREFPDPPDTDPMDVVGLAGAASLRDVLNVARRHGIDTDMSPTPDGMIRCGRCDSINRPDDVTRDWIHRLEGTTDPDELLSASAVRCPQCGGAGVLVLPFGPLADEVEARIARSLPAPLQADMAPLGH